MAIRVRKNRKNPYQVYWRNPTTHKLESKSVATRAEAEKLNALILYQLQFEPEKVQKPECTQAEDVPLTVERLLYLYLQDRNFTEANLSRTLACVKDLLERYGQMSVDRVDKLLLIEMQRRCLATGNKGATVRRKMAVIKAMFNWAYRNGVIESLPLFPVAPTSVAARYMPPTPQEVSALYEVAPEHLKRVIILGFMFGMRVGPCEMLSLRWEHVDIRQGVIRVPNAKKGNTDAWREVPIRASLLPLIREWQEKDGAAGIAYVVSYKGEPVTHIRHAWQCALKRAGVTRHIRPYDLRHGFATEAIAAGADYGTVAALMGHKSPMMVLKHYQHVKNAQKVTVMEKMPPIVFRGSPYDQKADSV